MADRDSYNQPTVPHYADPNTPRLPLPHHPAGPEPDEAVMREVDKYRRERREAVKERIALHDAEWKAGDRFLMEPDSVGRPGDRMFFGGCTGTYRCLCGPAKNPLVGVTWDEPQRWHKSPSFSQLTFRRYARKLGPDGEVLPRNEVVPGDPRGGGAAEDCGTDGETEAAGSQP